LRTEGLLKVLSEPRVTALSGQRANILSGGEVPVLSSSGQGAPTVQFREFGTRVEFTPLVLENGKIQLDVEASLSNRNDANGISIPGITPTVIPGFDTRRARTVVQIEDGQTVAIGGLIQNTVNASVSKIPFLGDLPFVGVAFSSKRYAENEEELLILVTPRLIDPLSCCQLPRYLPGRETRSPDDFELFLTNILEAPRGQREVCPDGRYRAAHLDGPSAGMYPCGDNTRGWNSRSCGLGHTGRGSTCGHANCGPAGCSSSGCGPVSSTIGGHTGAAPMPQGAPVAAPRQSLPPVSEVPVTPGLIPPTPGQSLPPISENDAPLPLGLEDTPPIVPVTFAPLDPQER
jgi:pilus assembly protein CpaC